LLAACAAWLAGRRVFGMRVTGWRETAIETLYWQVAWAYTSDHYRRQARAQIAADAAAGNVTTTLAPMPPGAAGGNPFQFAASGYVHQPTGPLGVLVRGSTRSPQSIHAGGGFYPVNLAGRWTFEPYFDGSSTGDTPNATIHPDLAIEACSFAHAVGATRDTNVAPWMTTAWGTGERGYVYELGNLPANTMCTRVAEQVAGREVIFLGIPAAMITRWWVVMANRTTFGPFVFPAPAAAPAAIGGPSAARTLA
jgi:hypothetical protein